MRKITIKDSVDKEAYDKVVAMLVEFNRSKTEYQKYINKPVEVLIKNEEGIILGGLYGRSIWGTLEIKTLAVNFDDRNKGIGVQLMHKAEEEAKRRGCSYISLDTFSFQAPKFYEKLGFKKIGTETDFPKGEEKYYYRKKLEEK